MSLHKLLGDGKAQLCCPPWWNSMQKLIFKATLLRWELLCSKSLLFNSYQVKTLKEYSQEEGITSRDFHSMHHPNEI